MKRRIETLENKAGINDEEEWPAVINSQEAYEKYLRMKERADRGEIDGPLVLYWRPPFSRYAQK